MNNILLNIFLNVFIRNNARFGDFLKSVYIAIMTLTYFGQNKMPVTNNLYDVHIKAFSAGQSYFKAIFNARDQFKSDSVEGLITELNARTISANIRASSKM